jgi:hypothetical protein
MTELTLEALAKRIEELERKFAECKEPKKDWRRVAGMFEGSEFMKQVDAECEAVRDAERQAAREGTTDAPDSPPGDEWNRGFNELLAFARSRAALYPPGFQADVSRESIYAGCGE